MTFIHTCQWCGAEATLMCGNIACNTSYCSEEHQRKHWVSGHGELCKTLMYWINTPDDPTPVPDEQLVGEFLDSLLSDQQQIGGILSNLIGRYKPSEDPPDEEVVAKLETVKDEAFSKAEEEATKAWKDKNGPKLSDVLGQMKSGIQSAKGKNKGELESMIKVGSKQGANRSFAKIIIKKIALWGVKLGIASVKVGAGVAAATTTVVGIPLDTLVDAISVALDVAIFIATVLEAVYGIARSFLEIKDQFLALLTFNGGPQGSADAVDALFGLLEKMGLKRRAQQFVGSIVQLFDRVIQWSAPLVGSVISLVIPYDASITGRVVEYFLYATKFIVGKAWLLMKKLWDIVPERWQTILTDRDELSGLMLRFIEMMKRLFPTGDDNWQSKAIKKVRSAATKAMSFHPLVVIGVLSMSKVDRRTTEIATTSEKSLLYINFKVNNWLDNVVIPNIDKVSMAIQAGMGLVYGLSYMLYAYTPDGTKRKLGIAAKIDLQIDALCNNLMTNPKLRDEFAADVDRRHHEMRETMCQTPTAQGTQFIVMCIACGVDFDLTAPYAGVPAAAERNFSIYSQGLSTLKMK